MLCQEPPEEARRVRLVQGGRGATGRDRPFCRYGRARQAKGPQVASRCRRPAEVFHCVAGSACLLRGSRAIPEKATDLRRQAGRIPRLEVRERIGWKVLFDAGQARADGRDAEAGELEDLVG